jgi:large subunit ribosomal protein L19
MAKKTTKAQEGLKELKGQALLRSIEQDFMQTDIPDFKVGDTVDVALKIREADKERVQVFSGVCITRTGGGLRENFTVRRIVQGEGVERIFPLHCPSIVKINVTRRGKARRSRLYYLRQRTGRATRLKEQVESKSDPKQ